MENADKPAFARPMSELSNMADHQFDYGQTGLSKREYFAAHADIPWNAVIETLKIKTGTDKLTIKDVIAYRVSVKIKEADELLRQLEK